MISSVASPRIPASFVTRANAEPAPQPAPAPAPQPPAESIDLSTIDCPYKAAQLPLLEPSFQLGIAGAIAATFAAAMGGGAQAPSIKLAFSSATGANQIGVNYNLDVADQNTPLKADGTLVGGDGKSSAISGGFSVNQSNQTVAWNGKFGGNDESFTFSLNQGSAKDQVPSLNLKGQTGSIPVNLNFGLIGDINHGADGVKGYYVDGTVGQLKYHTDNLVKLNPNLSTMPQPKPGDHIDVGTLAVNGTIGDRNISKNYTVGGTLNADQSVVVSASGSGVNAGVPQSALNTTLTIGNLNGGKGLLSFA